MGKKRTNDGKIRPQEDTSAPRIILAGLSNAAGSSKTPPGAQLPVASSKTTEPYSTADHIDDARKCKNNNLKSTQRTKRPRLPDHVTIIKRPIHHPAPPTPFASSAHPKTLYITPTTPFIPSLKRIRRLLSEIQRRSQQSLSSQPHHHHKSQQRRGNPLQATGRLKPADVERDIAEGSQDFGLGRGGVGKGEEEVFLKATGRAIERALQIGVHFQGEDDCRVRVEMGSVQAIDDIEIRRNRRSTHVAENGIEGGEGDEGGKKGGKKPNQMQWKDEDIPETRVRTLSSITVAIGFK